MAEATAALWERPVRWPAEGLPFDMRPLRYVLAAAEQRSFSRAAAALGMKVSSISRPVRHQAGAAAHHTHDRRRQREQRRRSSPGRSTSPTGSGGALL